MLRTCCIGRRTLLLLLPVVRHGPLQCLCLRQNAFGARDPEDSFEIAARVSLGLRYASCTAVASAADLVICVPAVEPWKLLPSLALEVRRGGKENPGRCVRKTCCHNEIVQKQDRPSHAGRLTKVVCTPLVPLVSRNTRSRTSRGHTVRTWPFLLQILPNCSQCILFL